MKTLLIIGNGFDLNCKLKSKFSNFFESKVVEVIWNGDRGFVLSNESKNNIWYLILFFAFYGNKTPSYMSDDERLFPIISNNNPLWMDVESYIKRIMTEKNQKLGKYLHFIGEKSFLDILNYIDSNKENHDSPMLKRFQYKELSLFFSNIKQIKESKTMTEFLFYELQLFETDFKNYISNEIKNNFENYKKRSKCLMKKLRTKNEIFYILDFNYTKPILSEGDIINHVHGNVDTKVIIGYDLSETNSNENSPLMLTKGWQKMFSGAKETPLPEKDRIECIRFYGHSLGEQDYSYFHALFDYYDIYSRSIILEFYYSEYEDTSEKNESIRADYISRVYRLLNKYVEESERENKRRTFVSRLQLENRLKIKKI